MKNRVLLFALCLGMLLPLLPAVTIKAGAVAASVSTDKSVYAPGEDIKVTANYTVKDCWVGIVPAGADGKPVITKGTIYWSYVPEGGLSDFSIKSGEQMAESLRENMAAQMGVTVNEMMALPTGNYFLLHISSGQKLSNVSDPSLITAVPFKISQFSMESTSFLFGASIPVKTLYKTTDGYIGISHVEDDGTPTRNICYTYVTDQNLNTVIDMANATPNTASEQYAKYGRLPAGRYMMYFVADGAGSVNSRDTRSQVYFDIVGATVEKTEFLYGEPIMVKGYGSGTDWIGIAALESDGSYWADSSIRWRYIVNQTSNPETTGYGVGVAFDIREACLPSGAAARGDLPVGEYVIYVGLDDCKVSGVSKYTHIPITVVCEKPDAPASLNYSLTNSKTGMAGGTLTVTFHESSMAVSKRPTKVELYWGDANGNLITGYNKIGMRKVTGATTEIEMTESMVIPTEAKKLMVRAYNGAGYSNTVGVDLPTDRTYRSMGNKVTSFQIASDLHIGYKDYSETHVNALFRDIKTYDPDSVGIFVAGDATDHGQVAEYELLLSLWQTANQNGLGPKLYLGLGNHEMIKNTASHGYNNSYETQVNRFMSYANQSLEASEQTATPYYYISRGGQHFIFLATEYCGTHAYLSDAQLAWLSGKLAAVAADGAPVFILLHQPLYNTIAGGLANEDGSKRQAWNGVIAGDANFAAWQALTEENGVNLNNLALMKDQYEAPLRSLLAQYPSAMVFSGHSHWIMESLGNIFEGTETLPNYMFNTASVSYLWTDNDELNSGTGTDEGGQAYFVTVYENCVEFRGRDLVGGKWIPNAYYRIWTGDCQHGYEGCTDADCNYCGAPRTPTPHTYNDGVVTKQPTTAEKGIKTFTCTACGATKTEDIEKLPVEESESGTNNGTNSSNSTNRTNGTNSTNEGLPVGAVIGIAVGGAALVAGGVGAAVIIKKKKRKS